MDQAAKIYPGQASELADILALAHSYRRSATALFETGKKGDPLSRAPSRLCAIHAIELYLNALLLHCGFTSQEVRATQHNLEARLLKIDEKMLVLRQKTRRHICDLTRAREYLITRYEPEQVPTASEINRVTATLNEVADKVTRLVEADSEAIRLTA